MRIDCGVGFKVIEDAAGAPRPGAQRAPAVECARLAVIRQTDDALHEPGAVVGLNAGGNVLRVAPAALEKLLLPGGALTGLSAGSHLGDHARDGGKELAAEGELDDDGNRAFCIGRRGKSHVDVHGIEGSLALST